ncbi:MAG: AMP-binding protein, partial [Bacteroidaceae bacterium]|nr:AMP-binding protein [Bacteroidaceae bacterium]
MSSINNYINRLHFYAENNPSKVAIVDQDGQRSTTYAELWNCIQNIATAIRSQLTHNTSPVFIPIVLSDGMEYLASTIAVWTTGNACVCLGSSFPQERIDYIVQETEASLVIDEQFIHSATHSQPLQIATREETDRCVLFYTSGSIGKPKGILHTDASFIGGITREEKYFGFSSYKSFCSLAPFYFMGVKNMYDAINKGTSIHILSFQLRKDIRGVEEYFLKHNIEAAQIPPSMLRIFHSKSPSLRLVITAGERLVNCYDNNYTIINQYGMTETSGGFLLKIIDQKYLNTPVGQPVDSVKVELINESGNCVRDGEEGELIITEGVIPPVYFKDPEKTQKLMRGGVFHTGDIMRRLPNGDYLFVQRKDWMVKINGQRVEPGEIEAVMRGMPNIKDAIVKGFTTPDQSRQYLVAYFIPLDEQATAESIKRHLTKSLPSYMVPLYYVKMEAFPRNANEKTDRQILPAPDEALLHNTYTAPRTALEERL